MERPRASERTAGEVLTLWLDEYFLYLKCRSYLELNDDPPNYDLVAAYLVNRKESPSNEYTLMTYWLHFVSNPEGFYVNERGESVPILERALNLTKSLKVVVDGYSKQDPSHKMALIEAEKNIKISMLAVCCTQFRQDVAKVFYTSFPQEDALQIPPQLWEAMNSGREYHSCQEVLESLWLSVRTFVRGFVRLLPRPALMQMAEMLVTEGHESDATDDEELSSPNFDIPPFNLMCLPKHMQELHERALGAWSQRLTKKKTMLSNRMKSLNIRERLKTIQETNIINNNTSNQKNEESLDDFLAVHVGPIEPMESQDVLPEDEEEEGEETDRAPNDNDKRVTNKGGSGSPRRGKRKAGPIINDEEEEEGAEPHLGAFRTSTQKEPIPPKVLGRSISPLKRPPLNQTSVECLSPIRQSSQVDLNFKNVPSEKQKVTTESAHGGKETEQRSKPDGKTFHRPAEVEKAEDSPSSGETVVCDERPSPPPPKGKARRPLHTEHVLLPKTDGESPNLSSVTATEGPSDNTRVLNDLRDDKVRVERVFPHASYAADSRGGRNLRPKVRVPLKGKYLEFVDDEDEEEEDGGGEDLKVTGRGAKTSTPKKSKRSNISDDDDIGEMIFREQISCVRGNSMEPPNVVGSVDLNVQKTRVLTNSPVRRRMRARTRWTAEEAAFLKAEVQKLGTGRWVEILATGKFPGRTNVDLKDKWRNMLKANPELSDS